MSSRDYIAGFLGGTGLGIGGSFFIHSFFPFLWDSIRFLDTDDPYVGGALLAGSLLTFWGLGTDRLKPKKTVCVSPSPTPHDHNDDNVVYSNRFYLVAGIAFAAVGIYAMVTGNPMDDEHLPAISSVEIETAFYCLHALTFLAGLWLLMVGGVMSACSPSTKHPNMKGYNVGTYQSTPFGSTGHQQPSENTIK